MPFGHKKTKLFLQHGLPSRVFRQKTGHDVVGRQHCGSGCGRRWAIDLARMLAVHMRLQVARLPERSGAVGADVVPALLVHRLHVPRQVARMPEGSGAVAARVRLGVRGGALARGGVLLSRHDRDKMCNT